MLVIAGYCAAMSDEPATRPLDRVAAQARIPWRGDDDRWPMTWMLCAVGAVIALAAWQQTPGWLTLVAAAIGTLCAAANIRRVRVPRVWAVGAVLCLGVAVGISARETATLKAVEADWGAWSGREREERGQRVATVVADVSDVLRTAAADVASDSVLLGELVLDRVAVGTLRAPSVDGGVESAILVFRGDRLIAHAGQSRTPIVAVGLTAGVPQTQLVEGPFHTSLVSRANSPDGEFQVATVALMSSAPPADRFVRSLTQSLEGRLAIDRTVIESPDSVRVVPGSTVVVVTDGTRRLARVRALGYSEGETKVAQLQHAREQSGVPLVIAVLLVLVTAWRRPARTVHRVLTSVALLAAVFVAPLGDLSNVSSVFDASIFYAPMGSRLTANIAALLITSSLALATLFLVMRSTRVLRSRVIAIGLVLLVAGLGPYLLRDLSRGIHLPQFGASAKLWAAWQLGLALTGATVLLAGATAGQVAIGRARGVPPITAPLLALVSAMLAPMLWEPPGVWPEWSPACWIAAIVALALTRRGVALVVGAAVVAGAGAATLTWGQVVRARMDLAHDDLRRLSVVDSNAQQLLFQFAQSLRDDPPPIPTTDVMLRRFAASELARAGYPANIARWIATQPSEPEISIALAPITDNLDLPAEVAELVRGGNGVELYSANDGPSTILLAAVPASDGSVTTIAVPPRTGLLPADPFATLTGLPSTRGREPAYRLSLANAEPLTNTPEQLQWRRRGSVMHGDGTIGEGGSVRGVHVEVDLRGEDVLLPRGALLVLLDVAAVLLLWGASAMADGAFVRWLRVRRARWSRSYRVRLSMALVAFFVAPAAIFAGWSWYRLQNDDEKSRELIVREALRVASATVERPELFANSAGAGLPLFLYTDGQLEATSDLLLDALAPLGRLLPQTLTGVDFGVDDQFATRWMGIGGRVAMVGFRRVPQFDPSSVLATPARGDEFALDVRRADLGVLVLFVTAIGALAAIWSSGVAARSLARPVSALREAALSIAAGRADPSLGAAPAAEFAPVYRAFMRMAEDLATSRAALEAAQRRTDAVLQNVASGVLALRPDGAILIANPRAETLLAVPVRAPGATLAVLPASLDAIASRSMAFLRIGERPSGPIDLHAEDAFDVQVQGRQLRARLTRLPSGAVLTLDDVTELASAQRVLAWGEMARQVAHEIKNPLTPIRLGVQHLRRAYRDGRSDFGAILDTNVTRVLEEIDHLDEIARAFSRYGTAPADRAPGVAVDVEAAVRDVMALERMGDGDVTWRFVSAERTSAAAHADPGGSPEQVMALAHRDELKEVLLNVLENARHAQASVVTVQVTRAAEHVRILVRDNGTGVAPDVIGHVFEPHFSTSTSGSGLGLAISRRLIEGWGGTIALRSTPGDGAEVEIALRAVR